MARRCVVCLPRTRARHTFRIAVRFLLGRVSILPCWTWAAWGFRTSLLPQCAPTTFLCSGEAIMSRSTLVSIVPLRTKYCSNAYGLSLSHQQRSPYRSSRFGVLLYLEATHNLVHLPLSHNLVYIQFQTVVAVLPTW